MRTGAFFVCVALLAVPAAAQDRDFGRQALELYDVPPDIAHCSPGVLKQSEKTRALDTLNFIRALHDLPPVRYDEDSQDEVMQAALLIAANGRISHVPSPFWKCWSPKGADGAQDSNLSGGAAVYLKLHTSGQVVADWLTDVTNTIANNVGHRRWLLNPFLDRVAFGRVTANTDSESVDGVALRVNYLPGGPANFTQPLVAWPFHVYPALLFAPGSLLSFSAVVNPASYFANQDVDYSQALVSVTQRGGGPVAVTNISHDNAAYGLPNNLQFAAAIRQDVVYDVTIRNVKAGGVTRDYSYWFRIAP